MNISGSFNRKGIVIGDGNATGNIATNTFMPMNWLSSYLDGGLSVADKKLLKYYLTVPELQSIINYRAEVAASGIPRMKRISSGEPVDKHYVLTLLQKPNPLQNYKEFAYQASVLEDVFGNGFVHNVFGTDPSKPQALWNLPSGDSKIIPVDNKTIIFNQREEEKIIKEYQFEYANSMLHYPPEQIIHTNDVQIKFDITDINYLKGTSKVQAVIQACENIITAYGARGILQGNSPMGIVTNKTKDSDGSIPMIPKDKEEVQEQLRAQYGLSKKKWQFIISGMDLSFVSMAVDVRKLKLFEEVTADQSAIANQYSFPVEIFQNNVTFENKKEARKMLYQDSTIPETTDWLSMLSIGLGLTDQDLMIYPDFSQVPVLQDDLEKRAKMHNQEVTALSKALADGALQIPEYRAQLEKIGLINKA